MKENRLIDILDNIINKCIFVTKITNDASTVFSDVLVPCMYETYSLRSLSDTIRKYFNYLAVDINNPFKSGFVWTIQSSRLNDLLHICDEIYKPFEIATRWDFPQHLTFKTINPGEQMTGTFHTIVLEDHSVWWNGLFYNM